MVCRILLLMLAVCLPLLADDVSLVRVGENWRYRQGTNEASSPVTAWRQLGFDDSPWSTGPSGFGYPNGGIGIATGLADMPLNYQSIFLRKRFLLSEPAAVKWLVLRMDYDDGFVAYINGREIARRGLAGQAGQPVPYNAPAEPHDAGAAEEIDVTAFTSLLAKGENVLAIQAHNSSLTNYHFAVVPELLANFQRGPFVQNASSNHIQVIWKTPVLSDTQIEFGTNATSVTALRDTNLVSTHVLTLSDLLPDTTYYYRASSSAEGQTASAPVETFRTLRSSGALNFVVFGDSGWGSSVQYDIARVIRDANPDLVIHTGDIIYTSFTAGLADTRCLSVYGQHMRNTPYYFALGNHDINAGDQAYRETFYLPTNSVALADHEKAGTSPEHYYSFDHGEAHFVILFVPYLSQYKLNVGDTQYNWLTNDLARTSKPWKIIVYHVPMNSSSGHRFDDNNYNQVYDRLEIREVLLPVAARYGVQLMLAGHEHGYERFDPTNGVHSITTAGGGVPLYSFTELDVSDAFFSARYNCLKVTINGDTLQTQALGADGEMFDSMTIQRTVPLPTVYQASWHSPVVETTPSDDGDGNIFGQRFDFAGTGLPTFSGKFSNLGRVFINNDQSNLYVGLDQVMIFGNNNIFLFIEAPGLSGVSNLVNVGNGIVDPQGQGADGLDFLSNLSFTNFSPALGCILGDEFGDGQFRSFARKGLTLNIGQGVFRLDAQLTDVPGIRLQQFHSTPQTDGMMGEENANFISIAIPLSELGPLEPGDAIKLGAVVGGGLFSTNKREQSRFLDDSFLGIRLIGFGQNPVLLQGVSVRLALDPMGDKDGDGLANEFELILGTDPLSKDSDGDSLLDGWEVAEGLNPLSAAGDQGATGDPDQDGLTNVMEQIAGTNPVDASSVLRMTLQPLGGRKNRLTWPAIIGKEYALEYADYPFTNFVGMTNFSPRATTDVESFEEVFPPPEAGPLGRLYRVRLVP